MKIFSYIKCRLRVLFKKEVSLVSNINFDCTQNQARVLYCYLSSSFCTNFFENMVFHPNIIHSNQMLKVLIDKNFCIDACRCDDLNSFDIIKKRKYDYILGFGPLYLKAVKYIDVKIKILFITENNPLIVREKYQERLSYYIKRHHKIPRTLSRDAFYSIEQYKVSDFGILISNEFNACSIRNYFKKLFLLDINGLFNPFFKFSNNGINEKRNSFLWFGSSGAVHKGLDILIDAFLKLPEKQLNIYGVPEIEMQLFRKCKAENIIFHQKISVYENRFITEVVNQNAFVLSLSCSEGMQSGIATCMMHGLIPIVTKETGYEKMPFIYEFPDYKLEIVVDFLKNMDKISDSELKQQSIDTYEYAKEKFSIEHFTMNFNKIIDEILL